MKQTITLLDRPASSSFGMTPIVISAGEGLRVLGLAPASQHRGRGLTMGEVGDLVRAGHALPLPETEVKEDLPGDTIALWVGETFAKRASAAGVPPAPLPAAGHDGGQGRVFLGPAEALYPYLERWAALAFRRFNEVHGAEERGELASLMQWVLPDRPEALAAAWKMSDDPDRVLQLQLRTFERTKTISELRDAHRRLLETPSDDLANLTLFVFTGHTATRREEIAKRFATRFSLQCTTFKRAIADVDRLTAVGAEDKARLMERGQQAVESSPLHFALKVLQSMPHAGRNALVVDSLRHDLIRKTLDWLQVRKILVVAVTPDDPNGWRQRLIARGIDPDQLLKHGTEIDIPRLIEDADLQIRESVPDSGLQEVFDSAGL